MGSRSELIPVEISPLKQDPAWKHVQMFKNEGKVHLKCIYCLKLFKGVPQDVHNQMLQSLAGIVVKSGENPKKVNEVKKFRPIRDKYFACRFPIEFKHFLVEQSPLGFITPQDEEMRSRASDRKKKGKVENSSSTLAPLPLDTCPPIMNELNMVSTVDKDQVHMAIGRFLYDIGAPLDAVNSSYFQPMIDVIASKGLGLQATS
ncbi:hypothetical protein MKX01_040840, partial [Papaver californicum]